MLRVPVLDPSGIPLMPTKASRARKWIKEGKAVGKFNKLNQFYIVLKVKPSGYDTQPIAIGLDPGKLFSGVAVQSKLYTLWLGHLELPFKTVKKRMETRAMMRRGRRGRRINRKLPFNQRSHRQKRYSNRKGSSIPPSIKSNKLLELKVISLLCKLYPITKIVLELIKAKGDKGFSPVMVGQNWSKEQLSNFAPVETKSGYETHSLRLHLGLEKSKNKAELSPQSHANDGLTLACFNFLCYTKSVDGHEWRGEVALTKSPFTIIRRVPISKRQLHLMIPTKGANRRKYGGSTTKFRFRKGDLVSSPKGVGYISGDTKDKLSVSDPEWKRIGQISHKRVKLIKRSTNLTIVNR